MGMLNAWRAKFRPERTGRRSAILVGGLAGALLLSACASAGSGSSGSADGSADAPPPAAAADATSSETSPESSSGPSDTITAEEDGIVTLALAQPYEPSAEAGGTDDYRCFLIDLDLPEDRFITGVRFAPGNPAVVHHAIVYRVDPEQVAAAERVDADDDGQGWSCFGGPGIPAPSSGSGGRGVDSIGGSAWLAAWAPGGREARYPEGTGVLVEAGSQAALQIHYNLRGGQGPDLTEVYLRTEPASTNLVDLSTLLLPAPVELPCLPGESGPLCDREASISDVIQRFGGESLRTIWGLQFICGGDLVEPKAGSTTSCDHTARSDMTIYAAAGHMHLLGRSISIEVNPDTDSTNRVLDIETWDFDNQARSWLPEPLEVSRGDVLRVTCTHDANLRNTLPALADLPPRYVTWGEGTTDEMCLGLLTVARG